MHFRPHGFLTDAKSKRQKAPGKRVYYEILAEIAEHVCKTHLFQPRI